MKSIARWFTVLAVGCLGGCARDVYEVEMRPEDGVFHRTLICWHEEGRDPADMSPLADEDLRRIEAIYGSGRPIEGGPKQRFRGKFQAATPDDVGGAGSYTHWTTSLGTLHYYVERFRGDDDLEAALAARRKAADKLADLAVGWAEAELTDRPGFARLRAFLDQDLRRDLRNVGIYAWQSEAVSTYEEHAGAEFVVRVLQYLAERDYLSPRDIPALYVAAAQDDLRPAAGLVKQLVLRELEADASTAKSLAWLGDPKWLKTSFEKYVRTTDAYRERVAQWHREHADDADAQPPEPAEVMAQWRDDMLSHFEAPGAAAVVRLTLVTETEPFATNGEWDADEGRVRWSRHLAQHRALPAVCFAAWSVPERVAQRRYFGQIVLDGAELSQYALWYEALPPKMARQWDAFLGRLSDKENVQWALRRFRFADEPDYRPDLPDDQQPASRADQPRRLILQTLETNSQTDNE